MIDALQSRVRALADDAAAKREKRAQEMPESAAIFREFTRVFGPLYRFTSNEGRGVNWTNPDPKVKPKLPPYVPCVTVSTFVEGLASGAIKPSGEIKERRRKPVWGGSEPD